jgi:hypothetical protein
VSQRSCATHSPRSAYPVQRFVAFNHGVPRAPYCAPKPAQFPGSCFREFLTVTCRVQRCIKYLCFMFYRHQIKGKHKTMQDCEKEKKVWASHDLWGIRPAEGTYGLSAVLPPITSPKLVDLDAVPSVTGCYKGGGDEITQDGKTFTPFYHDQQDCVIWYQGPDKKIYFRKFKLSGLSFVGAVLISFCSIMG